MAADLLMDDRRQVEEALGESERRYRRLLAATSDYIYTVKVEQGRSGLTSHGPGCEAVTGYTSADFAADAYLWYRIIHEEDRPSVLAQVERVLKGESPPPLDHRIIHRQGGVRWIRNTTIPHRDAHNRLVAYDGLITDITLRKRAELLLASEYAVSRELTKTDDPLVLMPRVLEHLCRILFWHHGVYWHWDDRQFRRGEAFWRSPLRAAEFEPRCAGLTLEPGRGLAGRVGAGGEAVWVPDLGADPQWTQDAPPAGAGMRCGCAFAIRSDHRIFGVVGLYSRDSQEADARMLEVLDSVGVHIGQFMERSLSKAHLEQERNLLRTLIDHLPDCIFVKDTGGRFLLNNRAHMQLLGGIDPREMLGKIDADFLPAEPAARLAQEEKAVMESGQPLLNREEAMEDRGGRPYWFLCTKVPLKNSEGKTVGLVGIGRDITERKRNARKLEEAFAKLARRDVILKSVVRKLRASHQELEATQLQLIQAAKFESLGTLAAGVAHEVKNPLQTILMGLDYLAARFGHPDEPLGIVLNDMGDAVKRADLIIRELLALSSHTRFNWVRDDINSVLERSLLLLKNALDSSHVAVQSELAAGLPVLPMDRQKLQQVFINVCLNAIQAMPAGGKLTVRTRLVKLDPASAREALFRKFKPDQTLVVAEVQDTGTGLAPADLPRVFDPFFTTKPVGVGTGLGLSVARKIIDLHGGHIDIRNAPGGGALVTVVLKT